jgi:hypothetical protein
MSACACCLIYLACKAHAPYYIVICSHSGNANEQKERTNVWRNEWTKEFWRKHVELSTRVLIFSTSFDWFFFTRKGNQRMIITDVHMSSCKVSATLCLSFMTLEISRQIFFFSKTPKNQFSWKSVQLFRPDGQTWRS